MKELNKFDKLYQKIITEMAENQDEKPIENSEESPILSNDEICKDWGWLNEMEWNQELGKKFDEANGLHKEMIKNDPEHHKLVEYDDGRCVHTYKCKCGFSYKVDSSRIIFIKFLNVFALQTKRWEF